MNTTLLTRNETPVDQFWVKSAFKNRYNITTFNYNSNLKSTIIKSNNNIKKCQHTIDGYDDSRSAILNASQHLNSSYPGTNGKIIRDYIMCKHANSLYFVGKFNNSNNTRLHISGNISWIIELYVDLFDNKTKEYPIYMYCYNMSYNKNKYLLNKGGCWCQLINNNNNFSWKRILRPPKPIGNYIGLGSEECELDNYIEDEINIL